MIQVIVNGQPEMLAPGLTVLGLLEARGLVGKRLAVDSANGLGGTDAAAGDRAIAACPTGTLLAKRTGYAVPVGRRRFDHLPIGTEVEARTGQE